MIFMVNSDNLQLRGVCENNCKRLGFDLSCNMSNIMVNIKLISIQACGQNDRDL